MTPPNEVVWAGIDTHTDTHTIALLDERGRPLGAETFTADPDGYDRLIGMLPGPGRVAAVGVEGTNSFGAALARRLISQATIDETLEWATPRQLAAIDVLLQCLLGGFGSVFPQCGLMVFPGVVIVSR